VEFSPQYRPGDGTLRLADALPDPVVTLMRSGAIAQYATVSAAGMLVDTPVLYFPDDDLAKVSIATGLSYPAKAERARRNPRVGLLLEGGPDLPVIAIAGMAAVRDSDLQGNVHRYLAETCYTLPHDPDWALARQAVWYWTRIIVEIAPVRILWWDSPAAGGRAPPPGGGRGRTRLTASDPAPPGQTSRPAQWAQLSWQELANQALGRGATGHLSVIDADGFPAPMRALEIAITDDGLSIRMPNGAPWSMTGQACLTFGGIETFLGTVTPGNGCVTMAVARTLPVFPMTGDMTQLWNPAAETRAQLMRRLEEELQRRGQAVPLIPDIQPPPSEGYRRRLARMGRVIG